MVGIQLHRVAFSVKYWTLAQIDDFCKRTGCEYDCETQEVVIAEISLSMKHYNKDHEVERI